MDPVQINPCRNGAEWWRRHMESRRASGPSINWDFVWYPCGCYSPNYLAGRYRDWIEFIRRDDAIALPAIAREEAADVERVFSQQRCWGTFPAGAD